MFNLEALLNSFGKDFYVNGEGTISLINEVNDFRLYDFLVGFFGGLSLDKQPEYKNTEVSKSIKLNSKTYGFISIDYAKDVFDNTKVIKIGAKNAYYEVQIDSVRGIICKSRDGFFVIDGDKKLNYYSPVSVSSYVDLSGNSSLTYDTDFEALGFVADDFITLKSFDSDEKWELNVGKFMNDCILNKRMKSHFHLDSFVNALSSDFFENFGVEKKPINNFNVFDYCESMYNNIRLRGGFEGANYQLIDNGECLQKKILLKAGDINDTSVTININYPLVDDGIEDCDKTIDILSELKDSKVYTTLHVNKNNFWFISKHVLNRADDSIMERDCSSIIAGDLDGARYYNSDSIAAYSTLTSLAFAVDLENDSDFSNYFIEPDVMVTFDESLSLDKQISKFTSECFAKDEFAKSKAGRTLVKKNK